MKNFIKAITIFAFSSLLLLNTSKVVLACLSSCAQDTTRCDWDAACFDCTFCQGHEPTSAPSEDVTGKVTNPIFSDRLKTMPGDVFLNNFLRTGISFLLLIGSVIFFFVLLSGGIKWLSSSGDKTKLEGAQKQISSSLTGLAILLSTFVIMKLVETLFGVSLLQFTLPTL